MTDKSLIEELESKKYLNSVPGIEGDYYRGYDMGIKNSILLTKTTLSDILGELEKIHNENWEDNSNCYLGERFGIRQATEIIQRRIGGVE